MNESPRPDGHWLRNLLILLMAGLAVHLILPQIATLRQSLQVIKGMTWWAVGLAAGAQVVSYLGSSVLLKAIAAMTGDRLSLVRGTLITAASYSFGLVAGGFVGGGAATYRWVHGSGVRAESALLAGWLPGLAGNGVLLLVAILGLIYLLAVHHLTALQALSFGLILFILSLVVAGLAWGAQRRPQLVNLAVRLGGRWAALRHHPFDPTRILTSVAHVFDGLDRLGSGGWRGPALGAAINVAFDMLTLYLVFVAAGHRVSPEVLVAGYGLPLLLGKVPLLPGGVGIVESGMAALYTSLGVPKEVAVVVVLTYRLLSFWFPSLLGFLLIPYLQHAAGGHEGEPALKRDSA
jgi:uncharacterized membrane protein YbhN (UPF0104 family)